ncbi:MAG TPA: GNAT family N-acetyltransferase [Ramlibacter sp.]|uniref:GNAT family N-acetyltransferase n=1 Tax=Ramlibacter sp. TaxID=1917967 RepID=UPI002CB18881|nr:GNAT family N-acetyltransferase [Ramlibacter sp.]HVZ47057.1 GNAT family N-acetyltransferase [Ramlibacter sp.]
MSEIDTARFGVRIARSAPDSLSDLAEACQYGRREKIRMLVLRVAASNQAVLTAAEEAGARLMDTVVTWRGAAVAGHDLQDGVRTGSAADAAAVDALARTIFAGYANHYRNDPALARAAVDEIHPSWAVRACRAASDRNAFLLACDGVVPVGFAALDVEPEAGLADVALFGIAPHAAGRGRGRQLLRQAASFAADRGARTLTYTTHLTNLPAQRMLCAAGFVPHESRHTFHLWFPA